MLKFQTRKRVATHVAVDVTATAARLAPRLRPALPLRPGRVAAARHQGRPRPLALPAAPAPHGGRSGRWSCTSTGSTSSSAGAAASTSSSRSSSASSSPPALTLGATLYVRVYYRYQPEVAPRWEYSQAVFAIFVVLDVLLLNAGRWAVRGWQERRWAAGENLTRVLVAGTGELGRTVAETLLGHRQLGYRVVGFLGERPGAEGHAGLPVVGTIDEARDAIERSQADQLYVALPLEDHALPRPARQGPQQRVRRHQGGPRRRAVRDHQGRARGPRRHPDHQPQRGAAPGLEQHGEAADGRGGVLAPPAGPHPRSRPAPARPARSPLRREGPGPASPGAHDPRREDVPDLQVPHDGRRGGEGDGPRLRDLGRPAPDADRRLAPAPQPRRAAPAPQRLPRRHEPRGSAPGAASLRPAVPGAHPRSTCAATASRAG